MQDENNTLRVDITALQFDNEALSRELTTLRNEMEEVKAFLRSLGGL